MPFPSFVGVKSMRRDPGRDIASYQISTLRLPSLSMFVVFCTKVAVLYQDFAYFFCIAAMSSSVLVIVAAEPIVDNINSKTKVDKKRMVNSPIESSEFLRPFRAPFQLLLHNPHPHGAQPRGPDRLSARDLGVLRPR